MFGFGAGFVLTQFGLRFMQPWVGVAISIPTSTLLFWCLAPFFVQPSEGSLTAVVLFACVGLFFPGAAALLNFESNRLLGPNTAGALSSMTGLSCHPGPARVERALRVDATMSVRTEIVAQALQEIGRAASATQPFVIAERRREGRERHQRPRRGIKSGSHHQV